MLKRKVLETMLNGTRDQRVYVCEKAPEYFVAYYFLHYLTHPFAPFHKDFIKDFQGLMDGSLEEVAWVTFRESAKTAFTKMLMCWAIVYKKKRYMNWDSYDKVNAESALVDVANELATNKRLKADFGNLYDSRNAVITEENEIKKPKRIGLFVTTNGVRVEAFSTGQSTRGRLYRNVRPDFFVLDDIENAQTKDSPTITAKTIAHIRELQGGLGGGGNVLYLGNYISDTGVMEFLINGDDKTKGLTDKDRCVVRNLPVMDRKTNTINWPGKYVRTDKEARVINKDIEEPWLRVISLEAKERMLGERAFRTEMMNEPEPAEGYFFDREKVKRDLDTLVQQPIELVGGARRYARYNASHAYTGGQDTAEGVGSDASAEVYIDVTRKPNLVVSCFSDNEMQPGVFGAQIVKHAKHWGEAFVVPEDNGPGYGTVNAIIEREYTNVYTRVTKNKVTNEDMKVYGFRTTFQTKYDVADAFRKAYEDGDLEIRDKALLTEMYLFKNADMRIMKADPLITRHFDLLRAAFLAYEGKKYAESEDSRDTKYKAPKREPYKRV